MVVGAIDAAVGRGTTVVVAAGNSGGDAASQQPASCNNVAVPGGTDANPAADNVLSALNLGLTVQGEEGYS